MAVAGIVNSLWDLRGRIEGKPVGNYHHDHHHHDDDHHDNDEENDEVDDRCGESWPISVPRSKSSSLISRNMSAQKLR